MFGGYLTATGCFHVSVEHARETRRDIFDMSRDRQIWREAILIGKATMLDTVSYLPPHQMRLNLY